MLIVNAMHQGRYHRNTAQICLYPRKDLYKLIIGKKDLFKIKHKVYAANRSPIVIDGVMLLRIGSTEKDGLATAAMVYVSQGAGEFYLSKKVLKDLGIVPREFPKISTHKEARVSGGENDCSCFDEEEETCTCLPRTLPPKATS